MRYILSLSLMLLFSIFVNAQTSEANFIEVAISDDSPFVEELITYTVRFYSLDDLREVIRFTPPNFNTFGRSSTEASEFTTETINGQIYNVLNQTYTLYPLQAGSIVIDTFSVNVEETPFQQGLSLESRPIILNVQEPPAADVEGLTNAIGQFEVMLEVDRSVLQVSAFLTISLQIQGTGNFERILAPDLSRYVEWPILDITTTDILETPDRGSRIFAYLTLPDSAQNIEIPSIPFAYFNPQTEAFVTRLTVPQSVEIRAAEVAIQAEAASEAQAILDLPLKLDQNTSTFDVMLPIWVWPIPPILAFFIWVLSRGRRREVVSPAKKPIRRRSSGSLRGVKQQLKQAVNQNPQAAYQTIQAVLLDYFGRKAGKPIKVNSLADLRSYVSDSTFNMMSNILQEASTGHYAPLTDTDVTNLIRRSEKLIEVIDSEWRS